MVAHAKYLLLEDIFGWDLKTHGLLRKCVICGRALLQEVLFEKREQLMVQSLASVIEAHSDRGGCKVKSGVHIVALATANSGCKVHDSICPTNAL